MHFFKSTIFKVILQIIIGIVFVCSALSKFYAIDNFEMYVYGFGWFSFKTTVILIRLIIGCELFMGLSIIFHWYAKKIWYLTLFTLIGFSVFLVVALFSGEKLNCHCLGKIIKMAPFESLIKNILLLGILFLIKGQKGISFRFQKILFSVVLAVTISYPFIGSPPDFINIEKYHGVADLRGGSDNEEFKQFIELHGFDESKQIICFFSPGCKFCKLASQKISAMANKWDTNETIEITYVFFGKEERLTIFWKDNISERYPYIMVTMKEFFSMSNNSLPLIVFLDKGEIMGKYGLRDLTEEDFKTLVNKQ